MILRINVASEHGNTMAALAIASRYLRDIKTPKEKIDRLRENVMDAKTAQEARRLITEATDGTIEFYSEE